VPSCCCCCTCCATLADNSLRRRQAAPFLRVTLQAGSTAAAKRKTVNPKKCRRAPQVLEHVPDVPGQGAVGVAVRGAARAAAAPAVAGTTWSLFWPPSHCRTILVDAWSCARVQAHTLALSHSSAARQPQTLLSSAHGLLYTRTGTHHPAAAGGQGAEGRSGASCQLQRQGDRRLTPCRGSSGRVHTTADPGSGRHGMTTVYLQHCSLYLIYTGLPAVQEQAAAAAAGFVCSVKCTAHRQLFLVNANLVLHCTRALVSPQNCLSFV
jgi:hypothetical protein